MPTRVLNCPCKKQTNSRLHKQQLNANTATATLKRLQSTSPTERTAQPGSGHFSLWPRAAAQDGSGLLQLSTAGGNLWLGGDHLETRNDACVKFSKPVQNYMAIIHSGVLFAGVYKTRALLLWVHT